MTELLVQSVGGVIRVFPAWPLEIPASFASLRAQGGFLVTATVSDGKVGEVRIESTAGGRLRVLAPWAKTAVARDGTETAVDAGANKILEMDTEAGEVVVLRAGA